MGYEKFFHSVTGFTPFPYQRELGEGPWPHLLEVPTGLGKTAGVVVAWLWKRLRADPFTPTRLVYCLPMRVLVEQTRDWAAKWIERAASDFEARNDLVPRVHLLMGGETETSWVEQPLESSIVIGTQDMLLSRALMRGYSMSRYQWPLHFALLHNDALWVFDEIQLMGAGLPTSAQLEAFRRRFPLARPSHSLWVSATLKPDWLATVDLNPHVRNLRHMSLGEKECTSPAVRTRREATKRLHKAATLITAESQKQAAKAYAEELAREVAQRHVEGTTTLVIVNTVERCQAVLKAMDKLELSARTFLVHARFRPADRRRLNQELAESPAGAGAGRIIIATQAVEAGVDMTSRVLFTELAPWSSLVQRLGRCNRYGEADGADVFWVDVEQGGKLAVPYDEAALALARNKLAGLVSASPADLPQVDEQSPVHSVIRTKDFRDLFNTDPDLTGFDVDISPYVRDADDLDVQLFWRDLAQGIEDQELPHASELCRASLNQAKVLLDWMRKHEQRAYRWDSLDGKWRPAQGDLRPGVVLMLDTKAGGYSERLGFDPTSRAPVPPVCEGSVAAETETYAGDRRSRMAREVLLEHHLSHVAAEAQILCTAAEVDQQVCDAVVTAAVWHDVGKAHQVFQATLHGCKLDEVVHGGPLLAKSPASRPHQRKHFRHELASALAWLAHRSDHEEVDLIAYLIAAHHGKVRLSLRSAPEEREPVPPFGPRFARGVWENEILPQISLADGDSIPPTVLRLDLMELGESALGPSWTVRTQRLLDRFGPFHLAWLESLVRIADWRASAAEQEDQG